MSPRPLILDVSRIVRRKSITGIDRVDIAYLHWIQSQDRPQLFLTKCGGQQVLLDQTGLRGILDRLNEAAEWGPLDLRSCLRPTSSMTKKRLDSDLRRLGVWAGSARRLGPEIRARLGSGTALLNLGHTNLDHDIFAAMEGAGGVSVVMIHDMIPLDHPDLQRSGNVARFRSRMGTVSAAADHVIANSAVTAARIAAWMGRFGRIPPITVAHLGTDPAASGPTYQQDRPYMVMLGTIEPRKNHAFALDLWDGMGADAPELHIIGRRGWKNRDLFARLDALPPESPIRELGRLSDAEVATRLRGARALLFPSLDEGFGLPVPEALQLGVPVIANTLPVLQEIAPDGPVYLPLSEPDRWRAEIADLTTRPLHETPFTQRKIMRWADHFEMLDRILDRTDQMVDANP